MRRPLTAASLAVLLWAAGAVVSRGEITITPEFDPATTLTRPIESIGEFRERLRVSIYEDPRLASPERLRAMLAELDLRSAQGRPVVDIIVEPQTGHLIGVDHGSIDYVGTLPDGGVIVSTRDDAGAFTRSRSESLVWARPDGTRLCFDTVDIGRTQAAMHFTLLVDRSGSMANVMDQVIATTRRFLTELPPNAQCTLITFAAEWTTLTPGGSRPCGQTSVPDHISAGGGTNILDPLGEVFTRYNTPPLDQGQRAVIIITDGDDNAHGANARAVRDRLIAARSNIRTFVFWLGNRTGTHLDAIADYFLTRQGEVGRYLTEAYGVLGQAYASQQVLRPRACPAGGAP